MLVRSARIAVEALLGFGLGALFGVLGAYAGLNFDLGQGHEAGAGFALGAAFGVPLGVTPGVWLAGKSMGGDGNLGWTLLGAALGTGVSAGLLAADHKSGMIAFASTVPVAGAIAGYELSSHFRRPAPASEKPAAVSWTPMIGLGYVGVAAAF